MNSISLEFRRCIAAFFVLVFLASHGGCAATQDDALLSYSRSAELQFAKGMEEFEDEDCTAADKHFQEVRKKFPYSRFAVLSELRLADCEFILGNHSSAAVAYQQFVRTHPTHEEAHYAAFRRGLSYVEMIPSDWVITPPSHERDQAATRDARSSLSSFMKTYPNSEYVPRAKELLSDVVDALVRHEVYVAHFYLSRDDRRAAAVRLEGVRTSFPESALVPDAMFLQAITFLESSRPEEAQRVFAEIIEHYPAHHQSMRARQYLKFLGDQQPATGKRGSSDG